MWTKGPCDLCGKWRWSSNWTTLVSEPVVRICHRHDLKGIGPPSLCWFHGEEPMPENNYRTCGECGHYWTREALIAADAEHFGSPRDPETIYACPLCVHDF